MREDVLIHSHFGQAFCLCEDAAAGSLAVLRRCPALVDLKVGVAAEDACDRRRVAVLVTQVGQVIQARCYHTPARHQGYNFAGRYANVEVPDDKEDGHLRELRSIADWELEDRPMHVHVFFHT